MAVTVTARDLVRRMQECFNSRRFDEAHELFSDGYVNHILGTTGFASGRQAWQTLTEQYPHVQVAAAEVIVDGDRVAIRSIVHGVVDPATGPEPELFEFFRIAHGRLAEGWGAGANLPWSADTVR